jgi:hypothetical protein
MAQKIVADELAENKYLRIPAEDNIKIYHRDVEREIVGWTEQIH